jgi:hypothetical protein
VIDWQLLSIPFYGGVDTKTDEFLVDTSKVLELQNGVFSVKDRRNKRTAISKRNGYTSKIANQELVSIATFQNQLLSFDAISSFSYSEGSNQNIEGSVCEVLKVKQTDLNRPNGVADGQDTIYSNGIRADSCIENSRMTLRFVDTSTGSLVKEFDVSPSATNGKLIACGQYIHFFYTEESTTSLILEVYDTLNLSAAITTETISSSLDGFSFDVSGDSQKVVVVWSELSGLNVSYYTKLGVQGSPLVNGLPAPVVVTVTNPADWVAVRYLENTPTGDLIYIGHIENQLDVIFDGLDENFNTVFGPTIFHTGGGVNDPVRALTFVWDNASEIQVFFDGGPTGGDVDAVYHGSADLLGNVVIGASLWCQQALIVSKSFVLNGVGHVAVYKIFTESPQSTVFVLHENGDDPRFRYEAAKINYGVAGGIDSYLSQNDSVSTLKVLPEAQVIGTKAYFSTLVVTKLAEQNEAFDTLTGSQLVELDSDFKESHITTELGKCLYMGGGFLHSYDSKTWQEAGFHYYPEILDETQTASTGNVEIGTYLYTAIYYYTNEQGDVERSGTAIPVSVTVAAASSTVIIDARSLNVTQKPSVFIELYRTLKNPPANAPFYKVISATNVSDLLKIGLSDTLSDAQLANNEILYTTGGVVDNIAPNAGNLVESYKNRIVMNDPSDANLTWISKEYQPGQIVNFSDLFTFRTNDTGGGITGYKQLDDKLLIFKENLIFYTAGDGPNNTGTTLGVITPEVVASDTGCNNASSIVLTPVGVMFKSAKGFYLMNRSLQLEYVGYDVEIYNFQSVTSAVMVENINQVRFLTDAGVTLVYDYLYKQWSTFTNHEGKDAVVWRSVYTYLRNNGEVWTETEGHYLDSTTNFRLKIKTPWIKLVQGKQGQASALGPQSYFRVRRFGLLGRYASRHILQVGVSYDYRPDVQQTYYFDTQTRLTGPAGEYGNDAYYGETTPYGGDNGADTVYQFRARTARQKCESIQFIIEDIPQPTNGESYGITDLSIEVGIKKGMNKLGARKTVSGA